MAEGEDKQLQILSIDDDPVNQMVVTSLLEAAGYSVATAMDGFEALEYMEDNADTLPDLLLLDVMMPRMSGYECLEQLRELYPVDLPIIMISAKSEATDKLKAFALTCNDYLTKPFDRVIVLARVETQIVLRAMLRKRMEEEKDDIVPVPPLLTSSPQTIVQPWPKNPLDNVIVVIIDLLVDKAKDKDLPEALNSVMMVAQRIAQIQTFWVDCVGPYIYAALGIRGEPAAGSTAWDFIKEVMPAAAAGGKFRPRCAVHCGSASAVLVGGPRPKQALMGEAVALCERLVMECPPCCVLMSKAGKTAVAAAPQPIRQGTVEGTEVVVVTVPDLAVPAAAPAAAPAAPAGAAKPDLGPEIRRLKDAIKQKQSQPPPAAPVVAAPAAGSVLDLDAAIVEARGAVSADSTRATALVTSTLAALGRAADSLCVGAVPQDSGASGLRMEAEMLRSHVATLKSQVNNCQMRQGVPMPPEGDRIAEVRARWGHEIDALHKASIAASEELVMARAIVNGTSEGYAMREKVFEDCMAAKEEVQSCQSELAKERYLLEMIRRRVAAQDIEVSEARRQAQYLTEQAVAGVESMGPTASWMPGGGGDTYGSLYRPALGGLSGFGGATPGSAISSAHRRF
mmetsp:Transcript_120399/g.275795  ORF Transcript_120399/g.275795 Transcript_120399/m.275795 type:complete len:625 (+) Transcript_120399:33-1907(+)